jgi:hypothetical protein
MVLSIILLEDKHKIVLHLSIFYEYNALTPHGKTMHVKESYVIFIHLFDSGILLIIDLNKKKKGKGGVNVQKASVDVNISYY